MYLKNKKTFLDFCSGIGGGRIGLYIGIKLFKYFRKETKCN